MTRFAKLIPSRCLAVLAIVLSCILPLLVGAETATDSQFPAISASGQRLSSVFDGLTPNQQTRNTLVLKSHPPANFGLSKLGSPTIRNMLGLGPTANDSSCPTGGICAQPGTTETTGQFCQDNFGCEVEVHNQMDTNDPTQGTRELYDCEQCCVDWSACTIDTSNCDFVPMPGSPNPIIVLCGPSPIIIDTEHEGFHLTSAETGVTFDISGTGRPIQISWTDSHFHNAFLALPGADGLVHNGKELFGDFTPQPPSAHPNGFLALAEYDKPANGGNGDGIIDERDRVFSRLRLWIDENHDGVCQQNELHRLTELGVYSLSLNYAESARTDQFGNQFRYRAAVNPGERRDPRDKTTTGDPGRWTFDVFFVAKY